MVDYNVLINKRGGVVPIKKYKEFYKKFGKYLKTTNQHLILTNHQVNCSNCGYLFTKEALMFFNTIGTKRMTNVGRVVSSDEDRIKRIMAGNCPKCGNSSIRIKIIKLKTASLRGTYKAVFICGEAPKVNRQYKKIEDKFVKYIQSKQGSSISPTAQIETLQYKILPKSSNRTAVENFVKQVKSKKGFGASDYQVKSYTQDGIHFFVIYIK